MGPVVQVMPGAGVSAAALPAVGAPASLALDVDEGEVPAGMEVMKSPMVGTFYRAPSPDTEPFSEVGTVVTEDSVLCIIEAMKVMNEIKAEMKGEVVEILVENGEPVEFGQPLFLLKKG
jgi:acetyl-CoA carboxylase biotin carboxyl carrier protein